MRNAFGEWFCEFSKKNKNSILLSGDIGYRIFDELRLQNKRAFINCGIAEQNMIGTAAGLAAEGFNPWVYTIVPFLIYRPYELLRNLICMQNLGVKLVGVGSGLAYDTLGVTHYGLEDLSLTKNLPNMEVFLPYDPTSAIKCFEMANEFKGPAYVRLQKGGEESVTPIWSEDGVDIIQNYGDDLCLVCHGAIVSELLAISEALLKLDIKCKVITVWKASALNKINSHLSKKNIFIEEHFKGGLFEGLHLYPNSEIICINPRTLDKYFPRSQLLRKNGISKENILKIFEAF